MFGLKAAARRRAEVKAQRLLVKAIDQSLWITRFILCMPPKHKGYI